MKKEIKVGDKVKIRNIDLNGIISSRQLYPQNSIIEYINKSYSGNPCEYGMKVYLGNSCGKIHKRKTLVYLFRYEFTLR